ncbi:copper homeostasis protein CutC (plasmid) [Deinococcus metallilatus]|uniref:PF03932 family protein CutC n=1 Tax=Deinococcus metallilatus TaxID=1211322 RepID=A0AAJ5F7H8_9DEIO|nr:copper homeostasis protein CutC [Deinococcus metallilatus]MBB5293503.1 copper homeostasis protein [Deinococcus metallilatus]QBY06582.1 copper homeostasis protein CutC [Deinococcus metallilatus]RXJ17925.1 copper homeostasis protein CutC [Deinococcus metallilatus]TLK32196.1 copper homeostasis protein CutC [Deinococcus metallilatus]GMA15277.1 copper homeostasis protein CutC [Deinococcus metallilatus]
MTPLIEVCVEGVDAVVTAQQNGADRVELCAGLALGGLTPGPGVVERALEVARIPVHVLVRPREGDFLYSDEEFTTLLRDVEWLRECSVHGVVIGCLTQAGEVDRERTRQLVQAARPMSVTFHRAFDQARDPLEALEVLVECGVDRVLTSGQRGSAVEGAATLRQLVSAAGNRITILGCGGLRPHNIRQVLEGVPLAEVHFSALQAVPSPMTFGQTQVHFNKAAPDTEDLKRETSAEQVRRMVELIRTFMG